MASRYFTGTTGGFWSVLSNWDNWQTLGFPTSNDVVYPNARNIYIDIDVSISALTNASSVTPAITQGGIFIVDYRCGNRSVNSNSNNTVNSPPLFTTYLISGQTFNLSGSVTGGGVGEAITSYGVGTFNIFGNIIGGTATNGYGVRSFNSTTFNIIGDVVGSTGVAFVNNGNGVVNISGTPKQTSSFAQGVQNNSNGTINVYNPTFVPSGFTSRDVILNNADGVVTINSPNIILTNGGTSTTAIVNNNSNGTVILSGNCYGPLSGTTSSSVLVWNGSSGVVNIYGDVIASGKSMGTTIGIIHNPSNGIINVFGNVIGGVSANTIGISNLSVGTINVTGNISGGTFSTNTPAIFSSTTGTINVSGNCVAGAYPALFSPNSSATNIVGGLVFNNISMPYYAYNLKVTTTTSTITSTNVTGGTKIFTTSGYTYGIPLSGNVRSGISYGYMNEYRGSMNIPSKHSVKIGTRFDTGNTYGEAIITTNDLNALFKSFSFTGI